MYCHPETHFLYIRCLQWGLTREMLQPGGLFVNQISEPKAPVISAKRGILRYIFIYSYRLPECSIHERSFAFTRLYIYIYIYFVNTHSCKVAPSARAVLIRILLLCRGTTPPTNECSEYGTKQSDLEVPVILEFWGIRSTPSMPSLPSPLWPRVVASNRVLFMGQIDLNSNLILKLIVWNISEIESVYLCLTELF